MSARFEYDPPKACELCQLKGLYDWASLPALWKERCCGRHLPDERTASWRERVLPILRRRHLLPGDNGENLYGPFGEKLVPNRRRHPKGDDDDVRYLREALEQQKVCSYWNVWDDLQNINIALASPEDDFFRHYVDALFIHSKVRQFVPEYLSLAGANLERVNLKDVDLRLVDLRKANLSSAQLQGADLRMANLNGAKLSGASLQGAQLSLALFDHADLQSCDLSGCYAFRVGFRETNLKDANLKGISAREAEFRHSILAHCDLSGAHLRDSRVVGCDATCARFDNSDCEKTSFRGSGLVETTFCESNLAFADFSDADIEHAAFRRADLSGAEFARAKLANADLRGALLNSTKLQAARLSGTAVTYESLSGTDILLRQLGDGSVVVERGRHVQFFISYSHRDSSFAAGLEEALKSRNIAVWIDRRELLPGDSLTEVIGTAISSARYVCAILSASSLHSHWVQEELRLAMADQIASGHVKILPIVIEKGLDLPQFLRGRYYLDMSGDTDFKDNVDQIVRRLERDTLVGNGPRSMERSRDTV